MKTSPTLLAITAQPPRSSEVFAYAGGEYPIGRSMLQGAGSAVLSHEGVAAGNCSCYERVYHGLIMPHD